MLELVLSAVSLLSLPYYQVEDLIAGSRIVVVGESVATGNKLSVRVLEVVAGTVLEPIRVEEGSLLSLDQLNRELGKGLYFLYPCHSTFRIVGNDDGFVGSVGDRFFLQFEGMELGRKYRTDEIRALIEKSNRLGSAVVECEPGK